MYRYVHIDDMYRYVYLFTFSSLKLLVTTETFTCKICSSTDLSQEYDLNVYNNILLEPFFMPEVPLIKYSNCLLIS